MGDEHIEPFMSEVTGVLATFMNRVFGIPSSITDIFQY